MIHTRRASDQTKRSTKGWTWWNVVWKNTQSSQITRTKPSSIRRSKENNMKTTSNSVAFILGFFIFIGLTALGFQLAKAAIEFKQFERSVTVNGLAVKEVAADVVFWQINFIYRNSYVYVKDSS